jgi:1-acyl-sn-glycerol-3-phosphate acyltransferase
MKKTIFDHFSDATLWFLRPFIYLAMKREIKVIHEGKTLKKQQEPFFLISNHFNTWDAFVVSKHVKHPIRFVATEIAFLDFSKRLGMQYLAQTIKKKVGRRESAVVRLILNTLQKGYAVGLFPEGDNTFYGETLDLFESTGKLIKLANVNVYLVKQKGGYLSQPRWADYFSKHGVVYTKTSLLFSKEQIQNLSVQQINQTLQTALYHNEYVWQKNQKIKFNRKKRAEGIERLVYRCNNCGGILTVSGQGDDIVCDICGVIGTINVYEEIEGNRFESLVDYNKDQFSHIEEVIQSSFSFDLTLNVVDDQKMKNIKIGRYILEYRDKKLYLSGNGPNYVFLLEEMKYPVNTMRHSFSFEYRGVYYNFTDLRHQFVLYEMIRYLNGSYKTTRIKEK